MKQSRFSIPNLALAGCVIGLLAGCASTKVTNRERLAYDKLPRPNQILIYDFAASAADVPADSAFAGQSSAPATSATAEQLALGRELGIAIAAQLATAIRGMGLPAVQVSAPTTAQVNDIVIYGEASGSAKIEGRAKATAKEIADVIKKRFQEEGWIN